MSTNVQIVADYRRLGAAVGLFGQTIHLFHQFLVDLLRQLQLFNFVGILCNLLIPIITQFVLQNFQLLAQDHVLLYLRHAGTNLVLQIDLQ